MIFTNSFTLLLTLAPTTLLAAPTRTASDNSIAARNVPSPELSKEAYVQRLLDDECDLGGAVLPVEASSLPPVSPGLKLSHVSLGIGFQNYTCNSLARTDKPKQVGAVAQLYNVTCFAGRTALQPDGLPEPVPTYELPALAYKHKGLRDHVVAQQLLAGHHEFTADGVPLFVLGTQQQYGYVAAKKAGNITAPAGSLAKSVDWLKLSAVEGDYKEVYRVSTAGGAAPATCEGKTGDFREEYATLYYFYR
ncbi:hypothetical protein M011DRAFT_465880 [Sporormia fimetaria CBS 119925]|uniref:Malate dehydrogenase n=1 Tax=Sporormia fimetaria CBS 119925 TaxID=1340428 RepID=A0A6A6VFQ0_9PLEO|nr:hypothetical protein M011DRAFT_465880 [Sporormia fimetaria CBS 119925]